MADLVPIALEQWRCICIAVDRNLNGALVNGRPQPPRQVKDSLELGQQRPHLQIVSGKIDLVRRQVMSEATRTTG